MLRRGSWCCAVVVSASHSAHWNLARVSFNSSLLSHALAFRWRPSTRICPGKVHSSPTIPLLPHPPSLQVDAEAADEGSGGDRKTYSENEGEGASTAVIQENAVVGGVAHEASSPQAKSPTKTPSKGGRGKAGQDESDEEGEVKDGGTPLASRDLRQEIGQKK